MKHILSSCILILAMSCTNKTSKNDFYINIYDSSSKNDTLVHLTTDDIDMVDFNSRSQCYFLIDGKKMNILGQKQGLFVEIFLKEKRYVKATVFDILSSKPLNSIFDGSSNFCIIEKSNSLKYKLCFSKVDSNAEINCEFENKIMENFLLEAKLLK
jgi:hypothetical protein